MRTPVALTLPEMQAAFRDVNEKLERLLSTNPDWHGRRFQNVGNAVLNNEWITKGHADSTYLKIEDLPETEDTASLRPVRIDLFAVRGPAAQFPNTIFEASDRNYQAWVSNGQSWLYAYGVYQRTQAQLAALAATLGTNDTGLEVWVTDFEHRLKWTGAAWVFAPGDPGSGWVAIGKPAGTAPNGGVWGICDGTAYTCLNADGTTTSLTSQNLTGEVFIKGAASTASQQAATRATWEAAAVTDNESAHTHDDGSYAVSGTTDASGTGTVEAGAAANAVGDHTHGFSASVTAPAGLVRRITTCYRMPTLN